MFKGPKITISPRIGLYKADGTGRDSYIYANDGGFLRENKICLTESNSISPSFVKKYDLALNKPINRYWNIGDGRDMYISGFNADETNKYDNNLSLPNIVRNEAIQFSPKVKNRGFRSLNERIFYNNLHETERRLLNRVFYGKEKGVDDRRLSPKVVFAQKKLKPSCHYLTKIPLNTNKEKLSLDSLSSISDHCKSLINYIPRRK